jgi:hypothetical protein
MVSLRRPQSFVIRVLRRRAASNGEDVWFRGAQAGQTVPDPPSGGIGAPPTTCRLLRAYGQWIGAGERRGTRDTGW